MLPEMIAAYYDENLAADEYTYEKDEAGQMLDRYIYTLCEQCCDCIPCSKETNTLVPDILSEEDPDFDKLIDVRRHNCPLHWKADVCALYPDIEYRREGLPEDEEGLKVCNLTKKYVRYNKRN